MMGVLAKRIEAKMGVTAEPSAYHGSPYDFDEFHLGEKVGGGEGSMSYGYGTYLSTDKNDASGYKGEKGGKLYEVDIIPDDSLFLRWHDPINKQPKPVKDALEKVGLPKEWQTEMGIALYETIEERLGDQKKASEFLLSLGIKGIKYEWVNNVWHYVVFDEKDLKIRSKAHRVNAEPAAYHGSPYDFDEFTTAKIGSGEGNQSYGWGLYFAGKKEIAEFYQKQISKAKDADYYEKVYGPVRKALDAALKRKGYGPDIVNELVKIVPTLMDDSTFLQRTWKSYDPNGPSAWHVKEADAVAEIVEQVKKRTYKVPGTLYEVEIVPDDDKFLDWDKPLFEQSDSVKNALIEAEKVVGDSWGRILRGEPVADFIRSFFPGTGGEAYNKIARELGSKKRTSDSFGKDFDESAAQKEASLYLKSLGVPGIIYLDADSRAAGEGTHNYVLFDEKDVKITNKAMLASASSDAEYLAAVEAGDTAKCQQMVAAAAKANGYNIGPVYHGTWQPGFHEFKMPAYFATNKGYADTFSGVDVGEKGETYAVYLKATRLLDLTEYGLSKISARQMAQILRDAGVNVDEVLAEVLASIGPDRAWFYMRHLSDVASGWFTSVGIDVVRQIEASDAGKTESFIVMGDPSLIKSASPITRDDAGKVIPLSKRFNAASNDIRASLKAAASKDDEYFAAIEADDMATAAKLVEEAAHAAGYKIGPVYHGTNAEFNEFKNSGVVWFSNDKQDAADYSPNRIVSVFLTIDEAADLDDDDVREILGKSGIDATDLYTLTKRGRRVRTLLSMKGYDGIVVERRDVEQGVLHYGVFMPDQIKSADVIVRDDAGNIVPLSKRFNSASNDIRAALSKEPWQMTREEYRKRKPLPPQEAIPSSGYYWFLRTDDGAIYFGEDKSHYMLAERLGIPHERIKNGGYIEDGETIESIATTANVERMREQGVAQSHVEHIMSVRKAIREGKPVPKKVLADYPELMKTQASRHTMTLKEKYAALKAAGKIRATGRTEEIIAEDDWVRVKRMAVPEIDADSYIFTECKRETAVCIVRNSDGWTYLMKNEATLQSNFTPAPKVMTETLEEGETMEEAVVRGLLEEFGVAPVEPPTYLGSINGTFQELHNYHIYLVEGIQPPDSGEYGVAEGDGSRGEERSGIINITEAEFAQVKDFISWIAYGMMKQRDAMQATRTEADAVVDELLRDEGGNHGI